MLGLIAFLYASPTIQALRMPGARRRHDRAASCPALHFASFAVPKLHAAPKAAVIPPAAAPRRVLKKMAVKPAVRRVPVVSDVHTNVAIPRTSSTSKPDPFANAPVVDDTVGGVPTLAAGATPTPCSGPRLRDAGAPLDVRTHLRHVFVVDAGPDCVRRSDVHVLLGLG